LTITLNRQATTADGHRFSAYGPTEDGRFVTWDHEAGEYAGSFERAEDAVDLMHELAGS
jgi:hypothetical protein